MKKEYIGILIILVTVAVLFVVRISQTNNEQEIDQNNLVPSEDIVYGGIEQGGIPSIDNPLFISVLEANAYIEDDDYGILINIDNQYRFYPYSILSWHQIVNDTFRDTPLAVTFSPLCNSGVVFERVLGDDELVFSVSENVYNNNLLLLDEAGSQWSQIMAQAITGDSAGERLVVHPYQVLRWNVVRDNYSQTEVLSRETGFSRNYDRNPYINFYHEKDIMFPLTHTDDTIETKELIRGVVIDNIPAAFTVLDIMTSDEQTKTETIGEETITATYNSTMATIEFTDNSGEQIQSYEAFWFCWVAHYPQTELFYHEEDADTGEVEPVLINPTN